MNKQKDYIKVAKEVDEKLEKIEETMNRRKSKISITKASPINDDSIATTPNAKSKV
jgi:S-adenosylmethionine synthetase